MLENLDVYWVVPSLVAVVLLFVAAVAVGVRPSEKAPAFPVDDEAEKRKDKTKKKAKSTDTNVTKSVAPKPSVKLSEGQPSQKDAPKLPGSSKVPAAKAADNKKKPLVAKAATSGTRADAVGNAPVKVKEAAPEGQKDTVNKEKGEQAQWQVQSSKKTKKAKIAATSQMQQEVAAQAEGALLTSATRDASPPTAAGKKETSAKVVAQSSAAAPLDTVGAAAITAREPSGKGASTVAEPSGSVAAPASTASSNAEAKATHSSKDSGDSGSTPAVTAPGPKATAELAAAADSRKKAGGQAEDVAQPKKAAADITGSKSVQAARGDSKSRGDANQAAPENAESVAFDELGGWQEAKSMRSPKPAKVKKARRE